MPLRSYYLTTSGELETGLEPEKVKAAFQAREGLLWIDVNDISQEDARFLEQALGFHPLAVEDCLSPRVHPPKIDEFDDYLFIILHGIDHTAELDMVVTAELNMFLGTHFVVTSHNVHLYSIEAVRDQVERTGRPMQQGADFLAHAIMDALVDNVLPTMDRMADVMDELEEEAIRMPTTSTLEAILKFKRSTIRINRITAPERSMLNQLSRGDFAFVGREAGVYYRDVYDHIVRIEDRNFSLRERGDNTLALYMSSVANRQNEAMKGLAMVATIFLPMTLLAGIYGMNFENMPELGWSWGYFGVLGIMGTALVATLAWFRARRWVLWGQRQIRRAGTFAVEPEKLVGYLGHLAKRTLS